MSQSAGESGDGSAMVAGQLAEHGPGFPDAEILAGHGVHGDFERPPPARLIVADADQPGGALGDTAAGCPLIERIYAALYRS